MESLQNLLIKYKRKSDETTTHTVMPNKNSNTILKFGHSLHVKNEEKIEFYNILDDLIFKKKINFPITESFNKMTPLILDLDMKYTVAEKQRYYTDSTIKELFFGYRTVIIMTLIIWPIRPAAIPEARPGRARGLGTSPRPSCSSDSDSVLGVKISWSIS